MQRRYSRYIVFLYLLAPFLMGIYYEWLSCVISVSLLVYLFRVCTLEHRLIIPRSMVLLSAIVIVMAYGFSAFWGVDHGMAWIGFVKFLPLPLFVLAVGQSGQDICGDMLEGLPVSGVIMTIASFCFSRIPFFAAFFLVNNRLAGFFQYPNTYGLFLLLGVVVLITDERWSKKQIGYLVILLFGILYSGSRTIFFLLVLLMAISLFVIKEKWVRISLIGIVAGLFVVIGIYTAKSQDFSSFGRFLTASTSSSTFIGRILYFKDAVPVIIRHPLGLGYLGYYFLQGSFQTGVYSVVHVHNDLLQLMLDVGWFPAFLMIAVIALGIWKGNRRQRLVILMIVLHSMFDFNLQFIAIDLILLSAMNWKGHGEWVIHKNTLLQSFLAVLGCICFYFGVVSAIYYMGLPSLCTSLYPGYTTAWLQQLTEVEETDEMRHVADRILRINKSVSLAYSAKARIAYAEGNFEDMITYKQQAITLSKYSLQEYLDYFDMLYVGIQLYKQNGDALSAEYCAQHMKEIPDSIDKVLDTTDPMAWMVHDKPDLTLPEEYMSILQNIE